MISISNAASTQPTLLQVRPNPREGEQSRDTDQTMSQNVKPSPPGLIDTLSAGFSAIAQRPTLLFLPVLLDLFLWLGPRLSMSPLVPELTERLTALSQEVGDNSAQLFSRNMAEILGSYNLFSALSTWPLGIPSLLAGNESGISPWGTPSALYIESVGGLLVWLALLTLSGLVLGFFYLHAIARYVAGDDAPRPLGAGRQCLRTLGFTALLMGGAFVASMLLFLTVEFAAVLCMPLAPFIMLGGLGAAMWGGFHLFFTVHAILLDNLDIAQAVRASVALVYRHRFSSVGLLLSAVVISLGLGTIWHMAPSHSWLRLVSIAGNAFVNTGLATATFIFYRERAGVAV